MKPRGIVPQSRRHSNNPDSKMNQSAFQLINYLVTSRDKIKSEKIRKQWKVEGIIDDIQNYPQKWNQRVLRLPENRLYANHSNINPKEKGI